jgi:hypothetical protein
MPTCRLCNTIDFGKKCCHCHYFICTMCYPKLPKNFFRRYLDIVTTKHDQCKHRNCYRYICNPSCITKEPPKNQKLIKGITDIEKTLNNIFCDPSQIIVDYWDNDIDNSFTNLPYDYYYVSCDGCDKLFPVTGSPDIWERIAGEAGRI